MKSMILISVLSLNACTYYKGMVISSGTLGSNQKALAVVSGESEKDYYLFGIIQTGDDSLENAVRDALNKTAVPSQGLIDVFAEKSCMFMPILPFLAWSCSTSVFGTATQYTDIAGVKVERQKNVASIPSAVPQCFTDESLENGKCVVRIPGR